MDGMAGRRIARRTDIQMPALVRAVLAREDEWLSDMCSGAMTPGYQSVSPASRLRLWYNHSTARSRASLSWFSSSSDCS